MDLLEPEASSVETTCFSFICIGAIVGIGCVSAVKSVESAHVLRSAGPDRGSVELVVCSEAGRSWFYSFEHSRRIAIRSSKSFRVQCGTGWSKSGRWVGANFPN